MKVCKWRGTCGKIICCHECQDKKCDVRCKDNLEKCEYVFERDLEKENVDVFGKATTN